MTPKSAMAIIRECGIPAGINVTVWQEGEETHVRIDWDLAGVTHSGAVRVTGESEPGRMAVLHDENWKRFKADTEYAERCRGTELRRYWFDMLKSMARTLENWVHTNPQKPKG